MYSQLDYHVDPSTWPEWGSAPRGPVISFDMAHAGELLDSIIGPDLETGKDRVYHVLRCELCISTHLMPLPSPALLAQYYREQFYQQDKPNYVERYERDRQWWEQCVHGPILRQCGQYLRTTHSSLAGKTFLDIGAGPGLALDVAKSMGAKTLYVEPNRSLRLYERGHVYLVADTLEEVKKYYQELRVDILYLYEVLEHQPCPEDFLFRCYDLLNPGGILVVVVPNDYNPLQLAACAQLGVSPWWLAPIQHLYYFTPKTLQLLVRRCGFDICDMRGTYPLETHLVSGENYIGNDAIGRGVHMRRMEMEFAAVEAGEWQALEAQYRCNLGNDRTGREMVCIARKP